MKAAVTVTTFHHNIIKMTCSDVLFCASVAHSGESYAGIYVPTLVNTIRMMNERASSDQQINLKGFMVCHLIS